MSIFDLEQSILKCWNVVDDIELLYTRIGDSKEFEGMDAKHVDSLMNVLLGMREVYEMRFQSCFQTFEQASQDYYRGKQ